MVAVSAKLSLHPNVWYNAVASVICLWLLSHISVNIYAFIYAILNIQLLIIFTATIRPRIYEYFNLDIPKN